MDCLPHPKTLASWYSVIDGSPGFTNEAFQILRSKNEINKHHIICSLVFDEITVRQGIEFDGNRYFGYVNLGVECSDVEKELAKEALVFMVVAINDSWKLPRGIFFDQWYG